MAIVWIAFLLSAIMCTGAQYIYLNENNDYVSNYEVMVQIQRLMTQQGKIRESVDSLRQMFERLSTHSGVKIIKKGCDPGWVKYKTHCYFIGKRKVSWIEAMYECEARCSHVVEIETKEESDWLARTLLFNDTCSSNIYRSCTAWTAGNDITVEGRYIWSFSNMPIDFTNWYGVEPGSLSPMEDCINLLRNGEWNDAPCTAKTQFICERSDGS